MPIFQCKSCHKHLPYIFRWDHKDDGNVSCLNCGSKIPVVNGIPVYLPKEDVDRVQEFQKIYEKSDSADPWNYDDSAAEHMRYTILQDLIRREFSSAKRVLDMGCSGGHLLDHLDELPFEEYFAFDINFQAVEKATKRINESKINKKRVTLFVANATDLPLENETFDLILCVDGIIGWELSENQKEKVFSEIRRLLKPGGAVIFVDYISRTATSHLYPEVFTKLSLPFQKIVPIHDRLNYEFESAIKGLLWLAPFRLWRKNQSFARSLLQISKGLGKHGAKHLAYIAQKTRTESDKFALFFFPFFAENVWTHI